MQTQKTLAEIIIEAINTKLYETYTAFPARIEKYDETKQKANVLPLLKKKYKYQKNSVKLPVIPNVPVQWPSSDDGQAFIHLPIKIGDLGMVVICTRSIDNWLSGNGEPTDTNDARHHDLSDAVFIPGVRPFKKALTITNKDNLIVKNKNLNIELYPDGKISISGASEEFLSIVDELLDELIAAKVMTMMGAQPFTADTITKLTAVKTKLATLKV